MCYGMMLWMQCRCSKVQSLLLIYTSTWCVFLLVCLCNEVMEYFPDPPRPLQISMNMYIIQRHALKTIVRESNTTFNDLEFVIRTQKKVQLRSSTFPLY